MSLLQLQWDLALFGGILLSLHMSGTWSTTTLRLALGLLQLQWEP